jgi:ribosomal protein S18 acetylase RimI-like enzyme
MLKIRKAIQKDVENISALWIEFIDLHESYENYYKKAKNAHSLFSQFISKQISARNSLVLVGLADNKICSYLLAKIEDRPPVFADRKYGLISDLAVSANYRRKGFGEQLFNESLIWFKKRNVKRIELTVATSNPISVNFWSKLKFKQYSERRYIELGN